MSTSQELMNKQNQNLLYALQKVKDKYSTDDQKNYFEMEKIKSVTYVFNVFFVIYYILAFITLYFLYKTTKYKLLTKVIIVVLLAVYPFIISTIEYFIFDIAYFLYAMVFAIPYKSAIIH